MFNPRITIVRQVSADRPDKSAIAEAAAILRSGGLVAFPTETVYGLGANALDAAAVESIFAAKGRPATNPIIVHVADVAAARGLVTAWPVAAEKLAEAFWPGPLTFVLPKRAHVPDNVTAGGRTVGIRVPSHLVALALLQAAELPIAAPSANRSNQISPTTAEHVRRGLEGRIDMILDAGPTSGGLESTVIDLTADPPRLLRAGLATVAQLEAVVGPIDLPVDQMPADSDQEPVRSPGQLERHYSPKARLICVGPSDEQVVRELLNSVNRAGWLRLSATDASLDMKVCKVAAKTIDMPLNPTTYSARLYAALHEMDDAKVELIVVDLPPNEPVWLAIHDRLRRASN